MGAGFRVIRDDLDQLASTFNSEAGRLAAARSRVSPPPPDGGDGALDAALAAVLEVFGTLETTLTQAVRDHAGKLRLCADQYSSVDSDVRELFTGMMEDVR